VAAIPEAATTSAIAPVTAAPAVAAAAPVAAIPEAATTSATAPVAAAPVVDLPASSQSIDTKTVSAKSQSRPVVAAKEPTKVASNEPSQGAFAGLQFSSGSQPIDIKAEKMTFDQNGKSVLWQGHVHTINGQSQVTSDSLRVNYGENFHDVRELIADGNVRISQGTRWATGDHAVLDQTKHTVVLTGSPVVHDGEDQIAGSKITVHLDTNLSDVENARAVIYPHQSRSPVDGTSSGRGNSVAPPAERSAQPPPSMQGSPTEDNTP
jgi:lipopolysaccharide transport protein LptA